jgi:DNA-binding CsgD family transcriptional regulator
MDEARRKTSPGVEHPAGAEPGRAERRTADTFTYAALEAALEAVGDPAFVVKLPDTLLFTNRSGREALARDAEAVRASLADPARADAGVRRSRLAGHPDHELVVLKERRDPATRAAAWARRHGLTPRQTAVLALLVEGRSNRAVAEKLQCSEKTIELHVSSLFARCGCESRYALVARFWNES